jgi:hypothetical protein
MNTSVLVLPLTVGLCGCFSVTVGRKFDATHVPDIRPCVTTEENLVAWFGEPYKRGNVDGLPTLQWLYVKAGSGGSASELLVALVNRDGKVLHFASNPAATFAVEAKDVCAGAGDAPAR